MNIKRNVGWAIAEFFKNGKFKSFVCVNKEKDIVGLSGFVYVYSTKKHATVECNELNLAWNNSPFKVVKVEVRELLLLGFEE